MTLSFVENRPRVKRQKRFERLCLFYPFLFLSRSLREAEKQEKRLRFLDFISHDAYNQTSADASSQPANFLTFFVQN